MIPIAVVGTGFGARIHVPGLRASGRFDVRALVGRRPERVRRVAERQGIPRAATRLADVLDDVAAVSIATPPDAHAELAVAAARASRHVLCEKPMARTVAEATAMRDAARTAGVVALVDHEFRFDPARATLAELIRRGDLGRPRLVAAITHIPLFADADRPAPAWWFDADAGGGWLGASGSHLIDALRVWLGDFAAVAALVETFVGTRRVAEASAPVAVGADDAFSLLFRMASGAGGVVQQSAVAWGPPSVVLRIVGSDASAWIDDDGRLHRAGRDAAASEVAVPPHLRLPDVPVPPDAGPFAARELPAFVRQAERFADAIEGRPASAPAAATFDDGLAVQRVIDAVRESARQGRWVALG